MGISEANAPGISFSFRPKWRRESFPSTMHLNQTKKIQYEFTDLRQKVHPSDQNEDPKIKKNQENSVER